MSLKPLPFEPVTFTKYTFVFSFDGGRKIRLIRFLHWFQQQQKFKLKMFSAVILTTKQKLVVPKVWCQQYDGNKAIIFNSKNENAVPSFTSVWRNFHGNRDRSYYGIILRDDSVSILSHIFYAHRKFSVFIFTSNFDSKRL